MWSYSGCHPGRRATLCYPQKSADAPGAIWHVSSSRKVAIEVAFGVFTPEFCKHCLSMLQTKAKVNLAVVGISYGCCVSVAVRRHAKFWAKVQKMAPMYLNLGPATNFKQNQLEAATFAFIYLFGLFLEVFCRPSKQYGSAKLWLMGTISEFEEMKTWHRLNLSFAIRFTLFHHLLQSECSISF